MKEVPDYMRGLGFFPSDYEIECLNHELSICGKRKIPFEELLKLFLNHTPPLTTSEANKTSFENSLKNLMNAPSADFVISKPQLVTILTESAEKIDEKDAELYLKEIFRSNNGKPIEEISLSALTSQVSSKFHNRKC